MIYGGSLRPLALTANTWKWYSRPGSSGGILNWGTFSWILTNGANVAWPCISARRVSCWFRPKEAVLCRDDEAKAQKEESNKDINQHKVMSGRMINCSSVVEARRCARGWRELSDHARSLDHQMLIRDEREKSQWVNQFTDVSSWRFGEFLQLSLLSADDKSSATRPPLALVGHHNRERILLGRSLLIFHYLITHVYYVLSLNY